MVFIDGVDQRNNKYSLKCDIYWKNVLIKLLAMNLSILKTLSNLLLMNIDETTVYTTQMSYCSCLTIFCTSGDG